jgi:hypothetical protein
MKFSRAALSISAVLTCTTATICAVGATPILGSSFPIPGSIAAAWGCATALVAWSDGSGLRASRIDLASRSVLDSGGITLSSTYKNTGAVAIAFDGTNYMIAWYDQRPAAGSGNTGEGVYAARVRESDGMLLDGVSGFPVMTLVNYNYPNVGSNFMNFSSMTGGPAIAFSAGNFLIAEATSLGSGWRVTGSRIRANDAVLLDGTTSEPWFAIGNSLDLSFGVAAAGGTNDILVTNVSNAEFGDPTDNLDSFLVSSTDGSVQAGVLGGAVSAQSNVRTPHISSSVASNGLTFFVGYAAIGDGVNEVGGSLAYQNNTAVVPPPVQFSSGYAPPGTAYDGKNFLAAWVGGTDGGASGVYAARVSPVDGTLIDPTPFQISGQSDSVILAGGSGGVSLAVQGTLAWLIQEDVDSGVSVVCSRAEGQNDAGGLDAGLRDGGGESGPADAAEAVDALQSAGPDAGQLDATEVSPTLDGDTIDGADSPDALNDATVSGGLDGGAPEADASIPEEPSDARMSAASVPSTGQAAGGCNVGDRGSAADVPFVTAFLFLPLVRRRRRRTQVD